MLKKYLEKLTYNKPSEEVIKKLKNGIKIAEHNNESLKKILEEVQKYLEEKRGDKNGN